MIVTEKLKRQIDYLHKKIGNIEWSGELITREEGTINDLQNWKIICEDIFLVDIGTSGYTGYDVDKGAFKAADIMDLYDAYPGLIEGTHKNHHIHTHHSMTTFFSGTDWSQLEDRGVISNYFMMLIVNHAEKYCSKVAFPAKKKSAGSIELEFTNNNDGFPSFKLPADVAQDVLVVMNCDVEMEEANNEFVVSEELTDRIVEITTMSVVSREHLSSLIEEMQKTLDNDGVDESFIQRYLAVKEAKKEPVYKTYTPGWDRKEPVQGKLYNDWHEKESWNKWDSETGEMNVSPKKKKKISDMTEKEWTIYENGNQILLGKSEGFVLVNKILSGAHSLKDTMSPISKLFIVDGKLGTKMELEDWIKDFSMNLRQVFYNVYPNGSDEDYVNICNELVSTFETFKYNRLVAEIIEALTNIIEYEIQFMYQ